MSPGWGAGGAVEPPRARSLPRDKVLPPEVGIWPAHRPILCPVQWTFKAIEQWTNKNRNIQMADLQLDQKMERQCFSVARPQSRCHHSHPIPPCSGSCIDYIRSLCGRLGLQARLVGCNYVPSEARVSQLDECDHQNCNRPPINWWERSLYVMFR